MRMKTRVSDRPPDMANTGISGLLLLQVRISSVPSMSGITRSVIMRSGGFCLTRRRISRPASASSARYPDCPRICSISNRVERSSSATSIRAQTSAMTASAASIDYSFATECPHQTSYRPKPKKHELTNLAIYQKTQEAKLFLA